MKLLLSCLLFVATAHAASIPYAGPNYVVYLLDSDEGRQMVAFNGSGVVVLANDIYSDGSCSSYPYNQNCYHTYTNGQLSGIGSSMPDIVNDAGIACGPHCVTNNGLTAYTANGNLYTPLGTVVVGQGWGDFLFLNSEGDVLWNDPRSENWFEAIDPEVVPEGGTLWLVGLGGLLLTWVRRRSSCESLRTG